MVSSVNGVGIIGYPQGKKQEEREGWWEGKEGIQSAEILAHMHWETCTRMFVPTLLIIS